MEYFSLGGVSLPWTPSALSYSAGHHIVKQDLIGGNRIWQMMGNNPGSIEVTGIIVGANRYSLRDRLNGFTGTSQTLNVGQDSNQVIVGTITWEQEWSHLSYKFTLEIQSPVPATTPQATALQFTTASVSSAMSLDLPNGVTGALSNASTSLSNATDPTTALPALQAAQTASDASVGAAETQIAANPITDDAGAQTILQFALTLKATVAAYQSAVVCKQASALLATAILAANS